MNYGLNSNETKKVLLIDDSLIDLRIIVGMLKTIGYSISIADNGRDGVARACVLQPDIILCDISMPDMSGYAVLRLLKADPTTKNIPLIFLTSSKNIQDRVNGLRLGAIDYIDKPANPEEVCLRVGIHTRGPNDYSICHVSLADRGIYGHSKPRTDDAIANAAINYMSSNLGASICVDSIAEAVGSYRKKLSDIFKIKYNTTVYKYLRDLRMAKSKEYLEGDILSVQSIAEILGFSSAANFATAFKERYGMSPSDFKKQKVEAD